MSNTLHPAFNDQDYAEVMLQQGTEVILKKLSVKNGYSSAIPQGSISQGVLTAGLQLNSTLEFREGGTISSVKSIEVTDGEVGLIRLETETSIYEVIDVKNVDHRKVSMDYLRNGVIGFQTKIPDGFYDGGGCSSFEYNAKGILVPKSTREILVIDAKRDNALKLLIEDAHRLTEGVTDMKVKIQLIALLASNTLGGRQIWGQGHKDIVNLCEADIKKLKEKNGRSILFIGELEHGVCRHRALLFKRLCDEVGISSQVVRGEYTDSRTMGRHVWNVVYLDGQYYIVDVMHDSNKLYQEGSEKAKSYKRINGKGMVMGGFRG